MLIRIKRLVKKVLGEDFQNIIVQLLVLFNINNTNILFTSKIVNKNVVNLNYCHDFKNIGDNISPVIVKYVASQNGININKRIDKTEHLYAVGSIITAGAQDCTIWGSGILNTRILGRLKGRKLDIRAVRGPLTRMVLLDYGFDVPEIYGDPALFMPNIYDPQVSKKYQVSVITHTNEKTELPEVGVHIIDVATDNYIKFVEEIKSSELIISSSLHGIIFAEAYGIKAILLKPKVDMFKYYDYYYSTGRYSFPIADTVSDALKMEPLDIPDFNIMRENLLKAFPGDLWQ